MADVAENSSTTVSEAAQNTQPIQVDNGSQTTGFSTPLGDNSVQSPSDTPIQQEGQAQQVTYDFKQSVPEGFDFSQEQSDKFVDVIKDMGLNNDQANAIAKYGFEWMQGIQQQIADEIPKQLQAQFNGWAEDTKKAYGADYDKALAGAGQAIEYLKRNGVPEIINLFEQTGAGSRVEMFQLLNVVSKLIESDPGKGVQGSPDVNGRLDKFYSNSDFSKL